MKGFELRVNDKIFHFETAREAYLFYLKNFAESEDFTYYKDCAGIELESVTDEKIIFSIFENVFNKKHHLYKWVKRPDGKFTLKNNL